MIKLSKKQVISIRKQLAKSTPMAVGYRIMVRPIDATDGFEDAEMEKYETLADSGFIAKTDKEVKRETHGSDIGVIVDMGQDAFKYGIMAEMSDWAKKGDVVIFPRYVGHRCEVPPGSGDFYHFMNDEDIQGKYEGVSYE